MSILVIDPPGSILPGTPISQKPEVLVPTDQHLVVRGLSWNSYLMISEALSEHRGLRITYDRGALEIMPKSRLHDKLSLFSRKSSRSYVTNYIYPDRVMDQRPSTAKTWNAASNPINVFISSTSSACAAANKLIWLSIHPLILRLRSISLEVRLTAWESSPLSGFRKLGVSTDRN